MTQRGIRLPMRTRHAGSRTLQHVRARMETVPGYRTSGRVLRATGMVIEAVGLRVALGNACRIELLAPGGNEPPRFAEAEVVGFNGERCC
jgi:flagellum-specific ATP synthase